MNIQLFFLSVGVALSSRYTMKGHVPALDRFSPLEGVFPCGAKRKHSASTMKM
jgi:hypothetical protein